MSSSLIVIALLTSAFSRIKFTKTRRFFLVLLAIGYLAASFAGDEDGTVPIRWIAIGLSILSMPIVVIFSLYIAEQKRLGAKTKFKSDFLLSLSLGTFMMSLFSEFLEHEILSILSLYLLRLFAAIHIAYSLLELRRKRATQCTSR